MSGGTEPRSKRRIRSIRVTFYQLLANTAHTWASAASAKITKCDLSVPTLVLLSQ